MTVVLNEVPFGTPFFDIVSLLYINVSPMLNVNRPFSILPFLCFPFFSFPLFFFSLSIVVFIFLVRLHLHVARFVHVVYVIIHAV